ncbi:MAG TPA: hypothetical protein VLX68_05575 [Chitinivibrionales bacterium]|nr:hypothetical protein [Chitinivibrionales bacterium]
MDTLSREQLDQLTQDITFVRKAIEKNSSILNQIDFRGSLRLTVLLSALSVFLFCGLFYFLEAHFGGFDAIPVYLKALAFCAAALDVAMLGILKNTGVLKSARAFDPGISLFRLVREYYAGKMYHHFIPTGLVLLFACVCAWETGHAKLIIPFVSIGVGLLYNTFNTFLRIDEFLVFGYWFIVTGCILVVFNTVSPLLGLALTLGCGLLLLSFIWYLPQKKGSQA